MSGAFTFGALSRQSLAGVHPSLVDVAWRGLALSRYDFAVAEGVRDAARQASLVARGVSQTMHSKHLVQQDGYGHAIDVVAVGDLTGDGLVDAQDRSRKWEPATYHEIALAMKAAAEELGVKIRWGGDFKSFFDGPHFELA